MRGVSAKFLDTLRASHTAVFRARVCTTFQTGTNPSGTEIGIESGDVTSSASNLVRSTLQLVTSQAWPNEATDLLAPYGQEIYVERGIAYGNGQREYVGLGYFRIDTPEQDDVPDGPVEIAGQDRMSGIVDGRFLTLRQFPGSMTRGQLVSALITEVYPSAVIEWDDTGLRDGLVGRTVVEEEDRAKCLDDFVKSLSKIGYFDHRGIYVVKSPPSISGPALWSVNAGQAGVMIRMSRSLTRESVYNGVVATGEAADTTPPARGVAVNLDPTSPTYWFGPFGPVPMFYSSPFLTTNAQAAAAAATLLTQKIGVPYQVTLDAVANPALEPYDVIEAAYPRTARSRSLRTERHVLDEVKIGLSPQSPVSLKTREQRIVMIGDPTP